MISCSQLINYVNIEYGKTALGLIMQNQFQSKKITMKGLNFYHAYLAAMI